MLKKLNFSEKLGYYILKLINKIFIYRHLLIGNIIIDIPIQFVGELFYWLLIYQNLPIYRYLPNIPILPSLIGQLIFPGWYSPYGPHNTPIKMREGGFTIINNN